MMDKTINDFVTYIKANYPKYQGSSLSEIETIETSYSLPSSYKLFLMNFGKGIDGFMEGSDYTLKFLSGMKKSANDILVKQGLQELPENAFVFWMHQGYQFCFFLIEDGISNPEIHYFNECFKNLVAIKLADTLSNFLFYHKELFRDLDEEIFI
jgi:hypothetical protein